MRAGEGTATGIGGEEVSDKEEAIREEYVRSYKGLQKSCTGRFFLYNAPMEPLSNISVFPSPGKAMFAFPR